MAIANANETANLTPSDVMMATPSPRARGGSMVRVLHLVNGQHYAGAERVQDLLALNLPEFGYEVGFACLKPGRFESVRRSRDSSLVTAPMRGRLDLRPAWRLAKYLKSGDYGLIHTHTPRAALVGSIAAKLTDLPLVHHVHSPTAADSTYRLLNQINANLERYCLRGARALIAVSGSMGRYAETLRNGKTQIHVVPNGVCPLGPLTKRPTPSDVWTLGMVALFRPRKGLETLLRALAALTQHNVRLRAVGGFETGEYERSTRALVAELGLESRVDFVGFASNVPAELEQMDVMVLPSLFGEGLPMVVLEAMAAGIPVVATRVEGTPEVVRHEIDGLLAQPGCRDDLARQLNRLLAGQVDWQALRGSAHRRQSAHYSAESMARGVAEVYQQVLA